MSVCCPTESPHTSGSRRRQRRSARGFTILEAMMAAIVMVFAITTSITVMQQGFKSLATARNVVTAGQIMQTEIEKLRAEPWAVVSALPTGATSIALDAAYSSLPNASRFTITRTITALQPGMLQVDFTVAWSNYDGRPFSRTATTYYAQYGLYDWFVGV